MDCGLETWSQIHSVNIVVLCYETTKPLFDGHAGLQGRRVRHPNQFGADRVVVSGRKLET